MIFKGASWFQDAPHASLVYTYGVLMSTVPLQKVRKGMESTSNQSLRSHPLDTMPEMPSSITLTYFDIPGPAEAIRLAFFVADVPFEDKRIDRNEFEKLKKDLPFAQLPILNVDGEVFPQSAAILRYAGKIGALYPDNPVAAGKVDAVIDCMFDIQAAIRPSIYETNSQRKLSMRKQLSEVTLPMWLGYLERWLERVGSTFFVGETITICDLVIYTRMKWLSRGVLVGIPSTILQNFKRIRAHSEAVASHPRVQAYYTIGPGKVTGDGAPPLPSSPPHSPLSPITLPGSDETV